MKNNNIIMPTGELVSFPVIKRDLKEKDNINIVEITNNHFLSKFYDYDLKKKIVSKRYKEYDDLKKYLTSRLKDFVKNDFLDKHLPGVKEASTTIIEAIKNNAKIMIVSDMDADGVTSGAILYKMFKNLLNYDNIEVVINKKKYGHGINKHLVSILKDKYKKQPYGLMITSDHGSHNRENLSELKNSLGIKIIVTDHHLFKEEESPKDIDGFVNPKRVKEKETDLYHITGTMVAYFTLVYVFNILFPNRGKEKEEYLYYLMSYLGLTIISDCVDLKSYVNRKILIKALTTINNTKIKHEPFWNLMLNMHSKIYLIDEDVLGFNIIPEINSPGRIDDPYASFLLLTAETMDNVRDDYDYVHNVNNNRKEIQKNALKTGEKIEYTDGSIKVMFVDNTDGIQGIIANNVLVNENYNMVIVFTRHKVDNETIYIGSGRSKEGAININELLSEIEEKEDIIINFGGHANAVGVKIKPDLKKFFNILKKYLKKKQIKPITEMVVEDYIYSFRKLLLNIFATIELAPYGKGFEKPLFASDFRVVNYRFIKNKTSNFLSMKVSFVKSKNVINVFYPIKDIEFEQLQQDLKYKRYVRMVYSFNINTFRNYNKVQLFPTYMRFYEL